MERTDSGGVRRCLWVLPIVLITAAVVLYSMHQRELDRRQMAAMIAQLDAVGESDRSEAIAYLFSGNSLEFGRIGQCQASTDLIEAQSANFSSAALSQLFDEVIRPYNGDWTTMYLHTPRTFLRSIEAAIQRHPFDTLRRLDALAKLDMMLQFGNRPGGSGLVWYQADDGEKALILSTLMVIAGAAAADPDASFDSSGFSTGLSLIGEEAYAMIEPLLLAASDDMRRKAWLTVAVLRDDRGRDAEWRDEVPAVAEAILAARLLAARDVDRGLADLRERLSEEPELLGILDALAALPRNGEGAIDLETRPDTRSAAPELLAELYGRHALVSYSRHRMRHFQHRDAMGYTR